MKKENPSSYLRQSSMCVMSLSGAVPPAEGLFPLLIKQVLFVLTHTQCTTRLIAFVGYFLRRVHITVLTLSARLPFVVHSVTKSI